MRRRFTARILGVAVVVLGLLIPSMVVTAEGTEQLGPANISLADGSGFIAAGTGMFSQPGTINLTVPTAATIKQVLLYWEGFKGVDPALPAPTDADTTVTISDGVSAQSVTGTKIGGPTQPFFFYASPSRYFSYAYRADITSLGLVSQGNNTLTVTGMDYGPTSFNNGAGIMVIYDDGTQAELSLRDGSDVAFIQFGSPLDTTVPQTYTFAAESVERTANLSMFFGSVSDGRVRPNAIKITVGGAELPLIVNELGSFNGPEWDTITIPVTVPAGVTSITVQALSYDDPNDSISTNQSASFSWIAAGLSVPMTPPPPPSGAGTGTLGYWKTHPNAWPVEEITVGGITYSKADAIRILKTPPRGDATINMFHQLVPAMLNVANGTNASCITTTIAEANTWMATYGPAGSNIRTSDPAWTNSGAALHSTLDNYNNGLLCAPSRD